MIFVILVQPVGIVAFHPLFGAGDCVVSYGAIIA